MILTGLGEDGESDHDTVPLLHVEQGVLDWVEDGKDQDEADGVVDDVAEEGDQQVLARMGTEPTSYEDGEF